MKQKKKKRIRKDSFKTMDNQSSGSKESKMDNSIRKKKESRLPRDKHRHKKKRSRKEQPSDSLFSNSIQSDKVFLRNDQAENINEELRKGKGKGVGKKRSNLAAAEEMPLSLLSNV